MPEVEVTYRVDGKEAWTAAKSALPLGVNPARVSQLAAEGLLSPCGYAPGPGRAGKKALFWPDDVLALKRLRETEGTPTRSWVAPSREEVVFLRSRIATYEAEMKALGVSEDSRRQYMGPLRRFEAWSATGRLTVRKTRKEVE